MDDSSVHVKWLSSLRCPSHGSPAQVCIDRGTGAGMTRVEVAGCCSVFVSDVKHRVESVLKADVSVVSAQHGGAIV